MVLLVEGFGKGGDTASRGAWREERLHAPVRRVYRQNIRRSLRESLA